MVDECRTTALVLNRNASDCRRAAPWSVCSSRSNDSRSRRMYQQMFTHFSMSVSGDCDGESEYRWLKDRHVQVEARGDGNLTATLEGGANVRRDGERVQFVKQFNAARTRCQSIKWALRFRDERGRGAVATANPTAGPGLRVLQDDVETGHGSKVCTSKWLVRYRGVECMRGVDEEASRHVKSGWWHGRWHGMRQVGTALDSNLESGPSSTTR